MTTKPKIQPYSAPAGGWGALGATTRVLLDQRTLVKGTRSLFRMNQPDGFKCPGCAWPDPAHRAPFVFCENGAKALAWETTAKRVTPEFFAEHTVSWLEQQSELARNRGHDGVAVVPGRLEAEDVPEPIEAKRCFRPSRISTSASGSPAAFT
jgi:hypothetical protein